MQQPIWDFYGMSSPKARAKTLDLQKVKQIIFDNPEILLDNFSLEYEQVADNIFMCCPIHEGSDNKQGLSISLTKQAWRCWTRGCHEEYNTDIFGFVGGVLSSSDQPSTFSDVLRYICNLYNVDGAKTHANVKPKATEGDAFSNVVKIFKKKRKREDSASRFVPVVTCGSSPYFEIRGFRPKTLQHFMVEDCLDRLSPMRNRSIIPIHFKNDQVGYIARSTKNWMIPKYLFSEGLRKTDYLYNYDNAIEAAKQKSCMFLVEGQGDVWKLHEAGVKNAVGLFGKDISETQKSLLIKSGITALVILTDNDQAGRESKIKINRGMSRLFNLTFPQMHTKDLGDMKTEKIKSEILIDLRGCY
jgi:5S rRNA maturation endonuclease (ribonuclease M5)